MNNISKGALGERLAEDFLLKKGYKILFRNYRTKLGEIDLISMVDKYIVFVEVKARSNTSYGYPYEAVNYKKQQKIINTSYLFLQNYDYKNYQVRYDIIEVYLKDKKIHHIENAFSL